MFILISIIFILSLIVTMNILLDRDRKNTTSSPYYEERKIRPPVIKKKPIAGDVEI